MVMMLAAWVVLVSVMICAGFDKARNARRF